MIYFHNITSEYQTEDNLDWLHILDHPYRILIIGGSRSAKTNPLLNLISHRPDIGKIYLC